MDEHSDVITLLRRSNELLEVLAKCQMSSVVEAELGDEKKRKLYELTGTTIPIKEVTAKVGMSTGSVSTTWQRWERLGILVKETKHYRRIFP